MHSHSAYSAEGNLNLYDWFPANASVETRLESCLTRDFTGMQRGTSLDSFFHIILPNLKIIHAYIYIYIYVYSQISCMYMYYIDLSTQLCILLL